jgi:hypothetical protein
MPESKYNWMTTPKHICGDLRIVDQVVLVVGWLLVG